ncbi:MAG: LysM peptidoglycan-binding domain-containing protein [Treponema sp.]|jgi:membrane-bound lytic murein transglycosylase D|nr:LysM peptidoglycan-binding domain-containing protein [Treponema sp.]
MNLPKTNTLLLFLLCLTGNRFPIGAAPQDAAETSHPLAGQNAEAELSGGADATEAAPEALVEEPVLEFSRPLRQVQYKETAGKSRLRDQDSAESPGHTLTISGFDQALTQEYIRRYSSPGGRSWLQSVMRQGTPYITFIRHQIEKRGLPAELVYLPVIESSFLCTAKSRVGAAGLWQFMKNSIGPFNMKITEWMDERMDFWKSTEGALRKLEDNYRILKDWPLALAAYNAGLGSVNQVIQQNGIQDYWILADLKVLKTETIHYVPKLLAVSHILSNPRRFGLEPDWTSGPQWTRLPVGKPVDLELLAKAAGIDAAVLKKANQELFYGVTPPDPGYQLKVLAADAPAVETALAGTDAVLFRYSFHTIQSGDTLSALALHYGITVEQIHTANPGLRDRYLHLGARIKIPSYYKKMEPYARRRTDDPLNFEGRHLVKRGESLWSIANAYRIQPEALAKANNMRLHDTLREGRSIKTPIMR